MVIVDTSVWVEFFKGRQPYLKRNAALLEENQVYALECVFAELMQGALDQHERNTINEYWQNLPKTELQTILLMAGIESGKNKWIAKGVGLIDSVIILSARETVSKIWTLDEKLKKILKREEIFE